MTATVRPALTAADMEVLAFERERFRYAGAKEAAVLTRFGDTPTRYYQRVDALLDHPAALAYDPELVNRLRRGRDQRRAARSAAARGARP